MPFWLKVYLDPRLELQLESNQSRLIKIEKHLGNTVVKFLNRSTKVSKIVLQVKFYFILFFEIYTAHDLL